MKTLLQYIPANMYAALFFLLLGLLAVAVTNAQGNEPDRIIIKGKLITPPGVDTAPYAYLEASSGETMAVALRNTGRFWVNAPVGDSYLLKFRMPGCVSKDVLIDATHAGDEKKSPVKRLEFTIALHADDHQNSMYYARPVGTVAFDEYTGDAMVQHHYDTRRLSSFNAMSVVE